MTKPRKQHQLIATIENAWLGTSKSRQYKNQPFYCLDIIEQTLLDKRKTTIYAFSNLVNKEIWKILKTNSFKNKKYLLYCEKRTRGWRLKDWQEPK